MNFFGEAEDGDRHSPFAAAEPGGELFVAAADQDELDGEIGGVEAVGDVVHHSGAVAAEKDEGGGEIWFEAEFVAKGNGIGIVGNVKIGAEDHSRSGKDVGVVLADSAGLIDGALSAGDDVLIFDGLDPEVRREVGEVGDDGDEGLSGADVVPALVDLAVGRDLEMSMSPGLHERL